MSWRRYFRRQSHPIGWSASLQSDDAGAVSSSFSTIADDLQLPAQFLTLSGGCTLARAMRGMREPETGDTGVDSLVFHHSRAALHRVVSARQPPLVDVWRRSFFGAAEISMPLVESFFCSHRQLPHFDVARLCWRALFAR